ncbi:hypothetical protein N0V93_004873 [Gnomoniopsis smithogilvyi]|uniref:Tryptophan dimethylallyltransferase n=1 Tax=Gnomoniopsis smithogilvyi TaxID=1191159 RepID=A0A9W8YRU3_9PEZI|nr:hypothetical protein N0V93_004873 [Gnomoniopsis smithogilvyi]
MSTTLTTPPVGGISYSARSEEKNEVRVVATSVQSLSNSPSITPDCTEKDETEILTQQELNAVNALQQQQPWDTVNSLIQFRNSDHQFWWDTTGRLFAKLIEGAGYTAAEQYRELFFYALWVAPELGPSPDENGHVRRWRSTGTPDSTPIDFSWEWGLDGTGVVRYSFEPIGEHAGTALDPLNQYATESWVNRLKQHGLVPSLDLECEGKTAQGFIEETTPKAGTVVALDIEKAGPVMKIYIYPGLKAAELGISNLDVVAQSIRNLPAEQYQSIQANVEPLLDYLYEGTEKWGFETGILSIDLVDPKEARIKIYIRAPHTTVDYLMDALTLGGRHDLTAAYSQEVIGDLKDLWQAFLADAPAKLSAEVPGRASPGFYYTVRAGKPVSPKMYLSPFTFCQNDADVLSRLHTFFSTRTQANKPLMVRQMENYEQSMISAFGRKTLEKRCGASYYIGAALQKDQLRVVTYLTPQTFECEQDRIRGD